MQTHQMRDQLYESYRAIRLEWETALSDLADNLRALDDARRQKADAEEALELYQNAVVMGETHKEGRINGSNAEKRKQQTALMIADLGEEDPNYVAIAGEAEKAGTRVHELQIDVEVLKAKISFLRNQARMISGLAHSLAG